MVFLLCTDKWNSYVESLINGTDYTRTTTTTKQQATANTTNSKNNNDINDRKEKWKNATHSDFQVLLIDLATQAINIDDFNKKLHALRLDFKTLIRIEKIMGYMKNRKEDWEDANDSDLDALFVDLRRQAKHAPDDFTQKLEALGIPFKRFSESADRMSDNLSDSELISLFLDSASSRNSYLSCAFVTVLRALVTQKFKPFS